VSIELVTVVLFGGLFLLLAIGVPVVFALGGISVALTFLLWGTDGLYTVATTTYGEITSPTLIMIPLFVLMGNFLLHSGIADRLFQALSYWLSGLRGGLAIVSLGVCVALAMCSGFGAGLVTMGIIAVPAMLKRKYDKSLALGNVMAGGVLGDVIPPSIIMIVYAYITRLSVGKLFFGGAIPGFICAGLYTLYTVIRCYLQPQLAPKVAEHVTWSMRWASLKEVILPALIVVIVLGAIFMGIATPTEAAGVGAITTLLCCFIYRRFSWKMLMTSCLESLKLSGMVLWILIAATLFGVFYTSAGAQAMVMGIMAGLPANRWVILIGMQIILLIFGCFMDDYAIITICAPIFMPIAISLGFDPIWFAIVFILNMQVAYLTPPFGWCLILMKGIAPPEVSTGDIWRSVPPFVAMQLLVLGMTIIFPGLALWLPSKMI
jgi:tripartite ATP-independent transporter DctM subunit